MRLASTDRLGRCLPDLTRSVGIGVCSMLTDWSDTIGYVAAALVLTTFYMRSMVALRAFGLTSNVAFVAYGIQADLLPIILLHLVLLPLNLIRLGEAVAHNGRSAGDAGAKEGS